MFGIAGKVSSTIYILISQISLLAKTIIHEIDTIKSNLFYDSIYSNGFIHGVYALQY